MRRGGKEHPPNAECVVAITRRIILLPLLLPLITTGNVITRIPLLKATSHLQQESSEYHCISESFILQGKQAVVFLLQSCLVQSPARGGSGGGSAVMHCPVDSADHTV